MSITLNLNHNSGINLFRAKMPVDALLELTTSVPSPSSNFEKEQKVVAELLDKPLEHVQKMSIYRLKHFQDALSDFVKWCYPEIAEVSKPVTDSFRFQGNFCTSGRKRLYYNAINKLSEKIDDSGDIELYMPKDKIRKLVRQINAETSEFDLEA